MTEAMRTFESDSPEATAALAACFAKIVRRGDVVGLEGPLGAGKTCFVRALTAALGGDPNEVSSPTFVLCQEYAAGDDLEIAHLDAYRLNAGELDSIGWDALREAPNVLIVIEWASRVASALPDDRFTWDLEHVGPHERRLTLTASGATAERIETEWPDD